MAQVRSHSFYSFISSRLKTIFQATQSIVLSLPSFDSLPKVFRAAKTHLSEIISAFEYFDRQSYDLVCKYVSVNPPSHAIILTGNVLLRIARHTGRKALDESEVGDSQAFVLIETSGGKAAHDEEVRSYPANQTTSPHPGTCR